MANLNEDRFRLAIAARHDAMLETLKVLARNMAAQAETTSYTDTLDDVESAEVAFRCVDNGIHNFYEALTGERPGDWRGASPYDEGSDAHLGLDRFGELYVLSLVTKSCNWTELEEAFEAFLAMLPKGEVGAATLSGWDFDGEAEEYWEIEASAGIVGEPLNDSPTCFERVGLTSSPHGITDALGVFRYAKAHAGDDLARGYDLAETALVHACCSWDYLEVGLVLSGACDALSREGVDEDDKEAVSRALASYFSTFVDDPGIVEDTVALAVGDDGEWWLNLGDALEHTTAIGSYIDRVTTLRRSPTAVRPEAFRGLSRGVTEVTVADGSVTYTSMRSSGIVEKTPWERPERWNSRLVDRAVIAMLSQFPFVCEVTGQRYLGRKDNIEALVPGSPVVLRADWQSQFFSPCGIEVFDLKGRSLANLGGYHNPRDDERAAIACLLPHIRAYAENVRPVGAALGPVAAGDEFTLRLELEPDLDLSALMEEVHALLALPVERRVLSSMVREGC